MTPTPAPSPLDYATAAYARRRWYRRILRWWPAVALLIVGGLGVALGPRAVRHWDLLRMQSRCLRAVLPVDRPVVEMNPDAVKKLLAERPGEYRDLHFAHAGKIAYRSEPTWVAFMTRMGLVAPSNDGLVLFMHERFTPSGRRRLVVISALGEATVIEPAGLFSAPKVVRSAQSTFELATEGALNAIVLGGDFRIWGGTPDPADRSRFVIRITALGVDGVMLCRLEEDESVSIRLADPAGFAAKVKAAAEQAAKRPE